MKVVAIVYLILLSPIFAMEEDSFALHDFIQDDPFTQLCYDRIWEGEKRIKELQEETLTTLQGKKDIVASVNKEIREKRFQRSVPQSFSEELDALLKSLRHPEDLLTVEQRRALMGFPILDQLQPIISVIDLLGKFIKKWQLLITHAKSLEVYANRTIWYHSKWTEFVIEIDKKVTRKGILPKDLLEIYKLMKDFRKQELELKESYITITSHLQEIESTQPNDLNFINFMVHDLMNFFHVRGSTLWEIIRYSNIVSNAEGAKQLTENYNDLPREFCFNNNNFIMELLKDPNKADEKVTISVPSMQPNFSSSRAYPTHSLPISPQKSSSLRNLQSQGALSSSKDRQVQSAPQSRSSTPLPIRTKKETTPSLPIRIKKEMPKGNCLQDAFVQPDQWEFDVGEFKERVLLLVHAKFILAPLCELFEHYNGFKTSYLCNLSQAYDILSPKAYLDMPGQPLVRIPQTKARKVCSLTSNGHLCFNIPRGDAESTIELTSNEYIDDLVFKKRRGLFPSTTKEQILQFWFETSFGIPSDPTFVCACDGVSFYTSSRNQQLGINPHSYSKEYITNPDAWNEKQNLDFLTVHKKHKGKNLQSLLTQIAAGQGSFKKLFSQDSIGLRLLFGFLTGECASPENFELVENGNIKRMVGKGDDSFLDPSFMLTKDKNHHLAGHNIFYLFPFMDQEIPKSVINSFISKNISLSLVITLAQLAKTQRNFDEFITKYKLTDNDDLVEMLELPVNLSKANVLGLTLTARKETIPELLKNDSIIVQNLNMTGITYGQIFQKVRPLEYHCYKQLLKNAEKGVRTTPIFFTQIIPSVIKQLRKVHKAAIQVGEIPLDSIEDLNSLEEASSLYRKKITEYLEAIEKLNEEKTLANSKKENLEREQVKNKNELSELRAQLILLTQDMAPEISPIPSTITNLTEISEKRDVTVEIRGLEEAGLDSLAESTGKGNTAKIEELRNRLKEAKEKKEDHKQKLENILESLKSIDLSLEKLHTRLLPDQLFKEFDNVVYKKAQAFFREKYKWAEENHIFYASIALKAWESLLDADKPIIYETFIKPASLVDWAFVPVRKEFSSTCDSLIDSNHSIESMFQDLIKHTDISSLSPFTALELLDRLLTLVPYPKEYHQSWQDMVSIIKKYFFGITPHVQSFFYSLGLQLEEEANVLQEAQLLAFEDCQQQSKMMAPSDCEQKATPGQFTNNLWHQLWLGSLELNQDDYLFSDGLIKFFSLPLHTSQLPAGLGSNPESKGGIFELRYEFGDHYPLINSVEWIRLFHSTHIFPAQIRQAFLSRARHLLLFQLLDVSKKFYPEISFHAWYPKTVVHKITLLQEFLQTHLSPTFNETMLAVWPELYFLIEEKFKAQKNDLKLTLDAHRKENPKLIPVENNEVNLDRHNMFSHLNKWEKEYLRCVVIPPLSLDDTATEWLADLNPADYAPKVLAHILELATNFVIDPKKINPALWHNPKILTNLVSADAPLACLQLVAVLRTGLPLKNITLEKSKFSYQISGLKGNVELIRELIQLFPDVTTLSLANNQLRSLKLLVPSLKMLPSLTSLNLSNNPLHNPGPLAEFPNLDSLNIQNTGIPILNLEDLKALIAKERKVKVGDIKFLEPMKCFMSGCSESLKWKEENTTKLKHTDLLSLIQNYTVHTNPSREDRDSLIYILEELGENSWLNTLTLERQKLTIIPCDTVFSLLQEFDPREIAYKLLFAIKFALPHGTNPNTLSFVNNTPSMQANCLGRLDVSKVSVPSQFLTSLDQFENLSHLSLISIGLTNLKSIPLLINLLYLDLTDNNINTLEHLRIKEINIKFPKLQILLLKNNQLTNNTVGIRFLEELPLTGIDLSHNLFQTAPKLGTISTLIRIKYDPQKSKK